MTNGQLDAPVSSLRQRMIEDMNMRRFTRKTQFDYVRHVARFAAYLGRPPLYCDRRRAPAIPGRTARGGHRDPDHEQHRVCAAFLFHSRH